MLREFFNNRGLARRLKLQGRQPPPDLLFPYLNFRVIHHCARSPAGLLATLFLRVNSRPAPPLRSSSTPRMKSSADRSAPTRKADLKRTGSSRPPRPAPPARRSPPATSTRVRPCR